MQKSFAKRVCAVFVAASVGAFLALVDGPDPVKAHSGGTDVYGCHRETATGTYHCHTHAPLACQNRTFANQQAMIDSACQNQMTLSVMKLGLGTGTVTSSPAGIACGTACSATFSKETPVTLTATAAAGSAFSSWTIGCTGSGTCGLTMNADVSAFASFSVNSGGTTSGGTTGGTSTGGSGGTTTGGGSGTVPSPTIGGAPIIFPHFAQGGGYQTTFTFNNLSNTAATVALNFYSQNGSSIGGNTPSIGGLGTARTAMTGSSLSVGWAKASMTPAVDLVGTETIQLFNSSGALVMEASVLGAQPDTTLRFPVYEKDGFGTGVGLVNIGETNSAVTVSLRNANGASAGSATISMGSAQQTARFVSELFPGINNFEGMLELTASRSIAALALRQHLASGIFSTVPVSPSPTEVFFSPHGGTSTRIVQEIQQAQSTIDIAIYSFTRNEIADALIAAKSRGVSVRILADRSEANGTGSDIVRLETAGIPLKRTTGGGGGILHDKYAIFDGRLLLTGSYNWSTSTEDSNDENAVFIRNTSVIAAFQSNFNSMWSSR